MNKNLKDFINEIERTCVSDLEIELDQEMEKPSGERDLYKIKELIEALTEVRGSEDSPKEEVIAKVCSERAAIRRKRFKRFTAAAACFAVMFFGANVASHRVLGQGVLPAGYSAVMGGIHTFLDGSDGSPDPHENIYYDTMKEKIDEYGLDVMISTYIPKGFELEEVEETSTALRFLFVNDEKRISVNYRKYQDNYAGGISIPTDTRDVYEKTVNGHQFYTIKEDQQLKAWCIEGKTITQICTYEVPYTMADNVLYSLEEAKK